MRGPQRHTAHLEGLAGRLQLPGHAAYAEHDARLAAGWGCRFGRGLIELGVEAAVLLGASRRLLRLLLRRWPAVHSVNGQLPTRQQALLAIRNLYNGGRVGTKRD